MQLFIHLFSQSGVWYELLDEGSALSKTLAYSTTHVTKWIHLFLV